jgi:hypothetical protein
MDKNKLKQLQAELNSIEKTYSDKPQWKIDRTKLVAKNPIRCLHKYRLFYNE